VIVTGAWYDPDGIVGGCVNDVLAEFQACGLSATVSERVMALRVDRDAELDRTVFALR
jgi:hypothetical protein